MQGRINPGERVLRHENPKTRAGHAPRLHGGQPIADGIDAVGGIDIFLTYEISPAAHKLTAILGRVTAWLATQY